MNPDKYDFNDDPGTPEAVLTAADAADIHDPSDEGCNQAVWE